MSVKLIDTGGVNEASIDATGALKVTGTTTVTGVSTEATLALIKAKTDNIDVLLSTRTKPADTQNVSALTLPLPTGAATELTLSSGIKGKDFDGNIQYDQKVTGTLISTGQTVEVTNASGCSFAIFQVTGSFTGNVAAQISIDGTNYIAVNITNLNTLGIGTVTSQIGGTGIFGFSCSGAVKVRLFATMASGSQVCTLRVTQGNADWMAYKSVNINQVGSNTISTAAGTTDPGTIRVVHVSDTSILTNLKAIGGTSVDSGQGAVSPGTQRMVLSREVTYSAIALGIVSVASATDIFTITGSGTKTVEILEIRISGTQATAGTVNVQLLKRSTANSSGTSSSPTRVPHDSNDSAATATILAYTANPTLGTLVGGVQVAKVFVPATASVTIPTEEIWFYDGKGGKPLTLRGTGEVIAINLNGITVTTGNFDCFIKWLEY